MKNNKISTLPDVGAQDTQEAKFMGLKRGRCFIPMWVKRSLHGYLLQTGKEFNSDPLAHRHVVSIFIGPIPKFGMVLHRCGHRDCVNPYHMCVGDAKANNRDRDLHDAQRELIEWESHRSSDDSSQVLMPAPILLSQEKSFLETEFQGFTPSECFHAEWLSRTKDGIYTELNPTGLPGEFVGIHRRVYELFIGPFQTTDRISHECGYTTCLNPYHLFLSGKLNSKTLSMTCDKRRTVTEAARSDIRNPNMPVKEVAKKHNLHEMTVRSLRTEFMRWGWS